MSSLSRKQKHLQISRIAILKILAIGSVGLSFLIAMPVYAERKYNLGTSFDFMAGMSNQKIDFDIGPESRHLGLYPFYSIYPSIDLNSRGLHSDWDFRYTFVGERWQVSPGFTNTSHAFDGRLTAQISKKAHLEILDAFDTYPDYLTVNVVKGYAPYSGGFQYIFEPEFQKQSNISNSARGTLDVDLSTKSYLTLKASSSFRLYEDIFTSAQLSNQVRTEESLGFSHRRSKRLTWSVDYTAWQNQYTDLETIRSHSMTVGLSQELSPGFDLTLKVGPSFTQETALYKGYIDFVASAKISKQLNTNRFSAQYQRRAGDSTGLGGASESHEGMLAFSQTIGRKITINFDASAFSQSQRSTNVYDYWGSRGSIAFLYQLGRYWVASIGGSYNLYERRSGDYDIYSYKRMYIAFGYRLPNFWKTER